MTVAAQMYFVLGDNRDNSAVSRYIGFVPRRNIVGRATHVVVSLDPDRYYIPRAQRPFRPTNDTMTPAIGIAASVTKTGNSRRRGT